MHFSGDVHKKTSVTKISEDSLKNISGKVLLKQFELSITHNYTEN